eukprot:3359042-Prymnesium_polylepis.1
MRPSAFLRCNCGTARQPPQSPHCNRNCHRVALCGRSGRLRCLRAEQSPGRLAAAASRMYPA